MANQDNQIRDSDRFRKIHFNSEENSRNEHAATVNLTPELYERLFVALQTNVAGDLRSRFGNPTPIGVLGFSVSVIPLATSFSTTFQTHLRSVL